LTAIDMAVRTSDRLRLRLSQPRNEPREHVGELLASRDLLDSVLDACPRRLAEADLALDVSMLLALGKCSKGLAAACRACVERRFQLQFFTPLPQRLWTPNGLAGSLGAQLCMLQGAIEAMQPRRFRPVAAAHRPHVRCALCVWPFSPPFLRDVPVRWVGLKRREEMDVEMDVCTIVPDTCPRSRIPLASEFLPDSTEWAQARLAAVGGSEFSRGTVAVRGLPMRQGKHSVVFAIRGCSEDAEQNDIMTVGIVRADWRGRYDHASTTSAGFGWGRTGSMWHASCRRGVSEQERDFGRAWEGQQRYQAGDYLRLELDLAERTLTAFFWATDLAAWRLLSEICLPFFVRHWS
jgi:hypothetical protein